MKEDGKKFRVQASNTTKPYVYCFHAACEALEQAQKVETGNFYFRMMAGVFAAFTYEAYLNHIGQEHIREWGILEKTMNHKEKLRFLKQKLNFTTDPKQRPFQTLKDIYELRDSLAHGKTKTIKKDDIVNKSQVGSAEYPQANWKKLCALKSVTLMVEDVEAMVRSINTQLGSNREPFANPEFSSSFTSTAK
jgi:hypothetical protein